MSAGLFLTETAADTANAALGAAPGRNGLDGAGVLDIVSSPGSPTAEFRLSNNRTVTVYLPQGPAAEDGVTPTFAQGDVTSVPFGNPVGFTLRPGVLEGQYFIDLTLPLGPKGDPGNMTGPASSTDDEIATFNGTSGSALKASGVKFGVAAGDALRMDTDTKLPAVDGSKLTNLGYLAVPAGMTGAFAANAAPSGWLKCNGALISRTTYAALFAAIGTTYGAGDGSSTFAVPDLRGEFVRGWDDGRGVDASRTLGLAQGDLFKAHTHSETGFAPSGSAPLGSAGSTGSSSSGTTGSTGGTETRPRNVALLYCIKF